MPRAARRLGDLIERQTGLLDRLAELAADGHERQYSQALRLVILAQAAPRKEKVAVLAKIPRHGQKQYA